MEKIILIIDDSESIRGYTKRSITQIIQTAKTIEAPDKNTAMELIHELRDKIFAVVCDGDLGDRNPFGGLAILDEAQTVGIRHLIFFASLASCVPEDRKRENIHYTDDPSEVLALLKTADSA